MNHGLLKFWTIKKGTINFSHLGKCRIPQRHSVDCQLLFRGQYQHITYPTKSLKVDNKKSECSLKELVKDCTKLRSEHGYEDKPVSEEELNFPLAFSIKMHTNSYQVERLLRTIYRPHNFYCIHVDLKANDETYNLIKGVADCLKNVVVLPQRLNAVHSSIRLVSVEMACMKLCMESDVKWKYYINLTGQEYVLRTNLEIVKILKIFNGTNDIEGYILKTLWRVRYRFKITGNFIYFKGVNKPFKYNITFYKGSAYGMFSRDFVDFVLTDNFVLEFYQWLKFTYAPEETIWSTLNRLPFTPGGMQGFDISHDDQTHASKAVIWEHDPVKCHGKFVRSVCILNSGDLPWLHSRPEIAANKFYEDFDPVVLDCLEEWVNNRTYSASLELNWFYYKNLPQVKYYQNLENFQKTKAFLKKRKEVWSQKFEDRREI